MLQTLRLAINLNGVKLYVERGSWIVNREELIADARDSDAEFFSELSVSGVEDRLAGFELATGKLPEAAVPLVRRALADQKALGARENRGYDADGVGRDLLLWNSSHSPLSC